MLSYASERLRQFVMFAVAVCLLCGCEPREEITTYRTPRTEAVRQPTDTAAVAQQLDHMLVAMLPEADQVWFFKLSGGAPAVDRKREEFLQFVTTLTPADQPGSPPVWKLPAGWKERGQSKMRIATLVVPDEDGPLEISVSALPRSGDWQDFLVRNVNRWLGQLSQGPLAAETVDKLSSEVATSAGRATIVELVGQLRESLRSNPQSTVATESSDVPKGPLTYDVPDGWREFPATGMRKATFAIVDDNAKATVTVIDLPITGGPQVIDVEANVRRWAEQVGLTNLQEGKLEQLLERITVDGHEGSYVPLFGPDESERSEAMLAAMVQRDDKVWFFKLFGDQAVVEDQQEAFGEFLRSVQFR